MKTSYARHIKTDMDAVPGGIDIQQLVVPRRPRTPMVPVQVNEPPPPQPSDGDDSMASSGSKSDSKDSDYHPSDSEE